MRNGWHLPFPEHVEALKRQPGKGLLFRIGRWIDSRSFLSPAPSFGTPRTAIDTSTAGLEFALLVSEAASPSLAAMVRSTSPARILRISEQKALKSHVENSGAEVLAAADSPQAQLWQLPSHSINYRPHGWTAERFDPDRMGNHDAQRNPDLVRAPTEAPAATRGDPSE